MSNKNRHHHLASPWDTVLTFDVPGKSIQPFRVHQVNKSVDGGLCNGGMRAQVEALRRRGSGQAIVHCYAAFVRQSLAEGFSFTEQAASTIMVPNALKLQKAIDEHRASVNGNPVLKKNLKKLTSSLKVIKT